MIKATAQLDLDVIQAVAVQARAAPSAMRREISKVVNGPTARRLLRDLQKEPPKPDYPIRWTSDKQRKAVMAKLRRSGNLPYRRTHRLIQGWRVVAFKLSDESGVIGIENSVPYVRFVKGEDQQVMFKKWPLARKVIRDHADKLQDEVIEAWYRVATGAQK